MTSVYMHRVIIHKKPPLRARAHHTI